MDKNNNERALDIQMKYRSALQILKKWGCNKNQYQQLLSLDVNSHTDSVDEINFNEKQVERLVYILCIHEGLSTCFNNPENIYGFMGMVNNNLPFLGVSPLVFLLKGSNKEFEVVLRHVQNLLNL
jgi:hypothetical protein